MENEAVGKVGDWLYGTLSPVELKKIIEHECKAVESADKVVLSVQISLFELEVLRLGHIPDKRNCFELYPRIERRLLDEDLHAEVLAEDYGSGGDED